MDISREPRHLYVGQRTATTEYINQSLIRYYFFTPNLSIPIYLLGTVRSELSFCYSTPSRMMKEHTVS